MKLAASLAAAAVLAVASTVGGQDRPASVRVDLPIVDAPYNLANGLRGPSMTQSLAVSTAFTELTHTAIQKAWGKHTKLADATLVLFDVYGAVLPGGDAWVHEEFHRAVMGNRDIDSFDDVYRLNINASTIAVSHVADDDLVRLKATHPADQVRLGAAGIEGENLLMRELEKNRFFYGSRSNNVPFYWLMKLNSLFYVASGAMAESDTLTDQMNDEDGANVPKRDFTGHDFTAWVYDLHRPSEPYTARGVHPSGVGIDRYIAPRDLSPEERAYLAREGRLQRINFIDLNLLGIDGFSVKNPWAEGTMRVSATASHYLTSFGHTIDLNLFVKQGDVNVLVAAHRYSNGSRSFPGVDAQLLNVPVTIAGRAFDVTPRLGLWMQPDGQDFRTTTSAAGALGSIRIRSVSSRSVATFVELEGKTQGWVAGNVHLDPNVSFRVGGSFRLR